MTKRPAVYGLLVGLYLGLFVKDVWGQSSPSELVSTVAARWAGNSESDFAAVFPFRDGQNTFSEMARAQFEKLPGLTSVIQTTGDQAVLLISGVPRLENSGDATIESRPFAGVYQ